MTASTVLYVGSESAVSDAVVSAVERGPAPLPVRRVSTRGEAREALDRVKVGWLVAEDRLPDDDGAALLASLGAEFEAPTTVLLRREADADAAGTPPGVDACVSYDGPESARELADLILGGRPEDDASTGLTHLLALSRTTSDCLVTVDTDNVVRFVNAAVEEVFGYRPGEVVGEPLTTLMPPDLADDHRGGMRRYLDTGERSLDWGSVELSGRHRDGHEVPVEVSFSEFRVDGERYFAGVVRDITERRERQRESERYERMVRTASDGLYALDADARFVAVNDAYLDLTGYAREELLGAHASVVTGADLDTDVSAIQAELERDEADAAMIETTLSTADGREVPVEARISLFPVGDGDYGRVGVVRDISERKRYEATLTELHEAARDMVDARDAGEICARVVDTAVNVLGIPGVAVYLRDEADGRLHPEATSSYVTDVVDELPTFGPEEDAPAWRAFERGETVGFDDLREAGVSTSTDAPVRSAILVPLGEHGVLAAASEATDAFDGRDRKLASLLAASAESALDRVERERELRRRGDQLAQLNDLATRLTEAETEREVCESVADAAHRTLGLPVTTVELYDEADGRLRSLARTPAVAELVGDGPLFASDRDLPWRVFIEGEGVTTGDLPADPELPASETPLRSVIALPIADRGVFVTGSTAPDAFSETDLRLATLLVEDTASALDRVDREAALRDQRDTLRAQTDSLERLNRINEVIRGITRELVQASARTEVEQLVCDRLAGTDHYLFAWFGSHDRATDEVVPRAWAGEGDGYLREVEVTAGEGGNGRGPTGRAIRTREPQVQNDVYADPPFEPWRAAALDRGFRASIAVPVAHQGTLYGVVNIYADQPDVFDETEAAVLGELGEMVGYALNALERRRALVSGHSVELDFRVPHPSGGLLGLATDTDYEFEFERVTGADDGGLTAVFTTRGATPDEIERAAAGVAGVEDLRLVTQRPTECLFECRLGGSTFLASLLGRGGVPRLMTAEGDEGRVVVRVPASAEIRSFVDLFERQYGGVELVARRELDESVMTAQEFRSELDRRLTDRQREVLRTAYRAGFFETPREHSAQEIAETLGVAQSTVSRHIRKGERATFALLFGDE